VNRSFCCAAVFTFAAFLRLAAAAEADPARIALDPDAYVGKAVTVTVKFSKIDNGREPWEEQANLKSSRMVKFTAVPLAGIKCYVDRTRLNMEALGGIKKGTRLVLSGAVRRYRARVKVTLHRKDKATGKRRTVERTEKGRVRYAFIVETIARTG
jgi:hypothetical protein